MHGLIYVSVAQTPFDQGQLKSLAAKAEASNLKHGITGYLYFEDGYFMQYIEGAPEAIEDVWEKLQRDPRHKITKHIHTTISRRKFPGWSMHLLYENQLINIGLDKVLLDFVLFFSKNANPMRPSNQKKAWELIDKLAYHKARTPDRFK